MGLQSSWHSLGSVSSLSPQTNSSVSTLMSQGRVMIVIGTTKELSMNVHSAEVQTTMHSSSLAKKTPDNTLDFSISTPPPNPSFSSSCPDILYKICTPYNPDAFE